MPQCQCLRARAHCDAATLYAAKAIQRPSTVGKVRGNFKITWVKMGRGDHKSLYKASRGLKFSDLFDAGLSCRWLVLAIVTYTTVVALHRLYPACGPSVNLVHGPCATLTYHGLLSCRRDAKPCERDCSAGRLQGQG